MHDAVESDKKRPTHTSHLRHSYILTARINYTSVHIININIPMDILNQLSLNNPRIRTTAHVLS